MADALELARDWYLVEQAEKQGSARVDEITKTAANLARRIDYEIVNPLKARIVELERQAEKRESELIKQVDCVIDLQAQLRAAQWAPARQRETVGDERWPGTVWLVIQEHGFSFCTPYSTDHIRLPEGYALCRKVQP